MTCPWLNSVMAAIKTFGSPITIRYIPHPSFQARPKCSGCLMLASAYHMNPTRKECKYQPDMQGRFQ